ncbi:esterase [Falsibacillus pallidus]|uniref:Peptidase S9 prolyl oligopeptidase catalytic domain-containing protein n=1 Tax=Falsibacillus pallidus TaxID=493781 RepID=A0A370GVV6_9BACI|nr:esterase [Falsibacillus pallidus]RDI47792.1 hypothetical protein DFR59_101457 [Falsibacillus pallidus]
MIQISQEYVQNIPLLHVVETEKAQDRLPTVFFLHGFTSAKEHNLHYAYLMAQKGFRVLMPEAYGHGERIDGVDPSKNSHQFWRMVIQTIEELKVLREAFTVKGLIDENRIGLAGTSMGAIASLGALSQYDWIKTAVSLMGNASYEELAKGQIEYLKQNNIELPLDDNQLEEQFQILRKYDLSSQVDKLNGRPILFWHGKRDPVVPFEPTYRFYQSIQSEYKGKEEYLQFIIDEKADHKVSREGLLKTAEWFDKHL